MISENQSNTEESYEEDCNRMKNKIEKFIKEQEELYKL